MPGVDAARRVVSKTAMSLLSIRGSALALLLAAGLQAQEQQPLKIQVQEGAWGGAGRRDIRKVLESAAEPLWARFPNRRLKPISVSRGNGGPITLYRRGPNGEIRVKLDVDGTHWAQFAYQFAHEFCHILCKYDEDKDPNEWFEEMLCELASLYSLRKMAESWKEKPPYPNWRSYAAALRKYADNRAKKLGLPDATTLAQFYAKNEKEFRGSKERRTLNGTVALALLPLFEESPEHWRAVEWINTGPASPGKSFRKYLDDWRRHAPERHRAFISRIAKRFDILIGS